MKMQIFLLHNFEKPGWVHGYQCCITLYSFLAFGLILVAVYHQSGLLDQTPVFYDDWNQPMIQNVQLSQQCAKGQINLLNWTWPGVQSGCDCRQANAGNGSDFTYFGMYYQSCSLPMLSQNCTRIGQIASQNFQNWGYTLANQTLQSLKLCATPSSLTMNQSYQIGSAINSYQKCGSILQVPLSESCPISGININISYGVATLQTQTTQTTNLFPLKRLTIGFDSICYVNGNVSVFQYLDQFVQYDCTTIDQRYSIVTINNSQYQYLLTSNNVFEAYNLIYSNTSFLQKPINLFQNQFTYYNYLSNACSLSDRQFIADLISYNWNQIYGIQLTSEIMVGVLAGVFGFMIPFIVSVSLVGCNFSFLELDRKDSGYKDIFKFWLGAKYINELLCTIILICNYAYQSYMIGRVQDFINNQCTDQITSMDLQYFHDKFNLSVTDYVLLDFILCLIVTILDTPITIMMCMHKDEPMRKSIIVRDEGNIVHPDSVKQKFSDRDIQIEN